MRDRPFRPHCRQNDTSDNRNMGIGEGQSCKAARVIGMLDLMGATSKPDSAVHTQSLAEKLEAQSQQLEPSA